MQRLDSGIAIIEVVIAMAIVFISVYGIAYSIVHAAKAYRSVCRILEVRRVLEDTISFVKADHLSGFSVVPPLAGFKDFCREGQSKLYKVQHGILVEVCLDKSYMDGLARLVTVHVLWKDADGDKHVSERFIMGRSP